MNTVEAGAAVGTNGLLSIIISLLCIGLSWWALQNFKFDLLVRHPKNAAGKMLHLLLAIVLGHFVSAFLIDYLQWTQALRFMF